MLRTIRAVVHDGKVELLEQVELQEGMDLLVTVREDDEHFWLQASQPALASVWNNDEDEVYAQLFER